MVSHFSPSADSTRSVYQKKLFVLLGGELAESPTFNGDVEQQDEEEEYSDSEPGEWLEFWLLSGRKAGFSNPGGVKLVHTESN